MFSMFCFALTLQKANWWHSKTDPFFTNCSPFNCLVTWFIWFGMETTFWLLCFAGIIGLISMIYMIISGF